MVELLDIPSPLRRVEPVSRQFGFDRGTPIDRYYIEKFLSANVAEIRGRVLEVGDPTYTHQFGGDRVTQSDVLHAIAGKHNATIIGDLATGAGIPPNSFDCLILTQVLQCVFDLRGAIATCHRCLKPGGVVLATISGISQISRYDMDRWGEFWRLTDLSARRLFAESFEDANVTVHTHGNVLAASAFLHGLAVEELSPAELDHYDRDYQLLVTIRAQKAVT